MKPNTEYTQVVERENEHWDGVGLERDYTEPVTFFSAKSSLPCGSDPDSNLRIESSQIPSQLGTKIKVSAEEYGNATADEPIKNYWISGRK